MEENIPRRLARFSRKQNKQEQQYSENYSTYSSPAPSFRETSRRSTQLKKEHSPTPKMPGMDYEDVNLELDKKNWEELQKIREKNLVEKLALEEIKKFKTKNNRMPNSKEEEQIAENLYKQLKNNPIYDESLPQTTRGKRSRRKTNQSTSTESSTGFDFGEDTEIIALEEEPIKSTKPLPQKNEDEFDLGLEEISEEPQIKNYEENEEEIRELEEFSLDDTKNCPNCKKPTEKIIYCPKCGTALCKNCATTDNKNNTCPQCGTKINL